jgi:iron only hydrogenase large subunit-like protein
MENQTPEIIEALGFIEKKEKMVAMLAPSFPIDFDYPEIIGMLKRLGFDYVVEVARGAIETNKQLNELIERNPDNRYISNPCPTIVRMIRRQHPELLSFLTQIDSPMVATAKIVAEKYPGYKKVFIGPCIAKKLEAKEDYPELDILVLTYKELQKIFDIKNISPGINDELQSFDITGRQTRLYSMSGGLAQSSCLTKNLARSDLDVISGPQAVQKALNEFFTDTDVRVLDILSCEGGCVNGPGIISKDPMDVRRDKVIALWEKSN